ncbi:MAG: hypothetical protein ACNI3H_13225 [Halarcobacter ebronensis]
MKEKYLLVKDETKGQRTFWQLLDKKLLAITIVSLVLTYISYNYIQNDILQLAIYLVAYFLVGWDVLYKAGKNLLKWKAI